VSVVLFGPRGTFGRLVAAELGDFDEGCDVTDRDACRRALEGRRVAVCCAGPFQRFDDSLLRACLDAGCSYVDIADDRAYCARVRGLGPEFERAGLTAAYGCSSLPGVSGALFARLRPERSRITLFIGNANPKGRGAIASLLAQLGRPFAAPQGIRRGFRAGEAVDLPAPFGRRRVYDLDAPDYDVLDARELRVKAGFESRVATGVLAACAALRPPFARALCSLGPLFPRFGHSGGVVQCEDLDDGRRAGVACAKDGQRMAALPAVYAARAILAGETRPGAVTAYELLGAEALLDLLARDGHEVY